ncbi:MAG: hypothetical protein H6877_15355 [Rhodobiaceae bacterium]|nr:hypothetical protein [Rhodobiaceae bacterium]
MSQLTVAKDRAIITLIVGVEPIQGSRMGLIEQQAVDRAFRAGLLEGDSEAARGLREDSSLGAGELLIMSTKRLAGLDDPQSAYETGRVLRLVAKLFDRARAPSVVSEQFRDNLSAAIMTHHMRKTRRSWKVEDTIEMFIEMYERILTPAGDELDLIRRYLQDRCRKPAANADGHDGKSGRSQGWGFGRLRAA